MIDKISIKELCNRAGFNRATFYLHFQDIYDLREQIENVLLSDLKDIFYELGNSITQIKIPDQAKETFSRMLAYIKMHHLYFESLIGSSGDISFINEMKDNMKLVLYDVLLLRVNEKEINKDLFEFILEYGLSANIGIITYWIKTGMKMPVNELVALFDELMFNGLAHGVLTPLASNSFLKENMAQLQSIGDNTIEGEVKLDSELQL